MKIDYDEIARILNTFIESESAFITLGDLNFYDMSIEEMDKFLFHFLLLVNNEIICSHDLTTKDPRSVGIIYTSAGIRGRNRPMMLTQAGYDLASALNKKPILERLKKEFSDAPFDMIVQTGKTLLTKFVEKRLGL